MLFHGSVVSPFGEYIGGVYDVAETIFDDLVLKNIGNNILTLPVIGKDDIINVTKKFKAQNIQN